MLKVSASTSKRLKELQPVAVRLIQGGLAGIFLSCGLGKYGQSVIVAGLISAAIGLLIKIAGRFQVR
jgi:hypothetical protein